MDRGTPGMVAKMVVMVVMVVMVGTVVTVETMVQVVTVVKIATVVKMSDGRGSNDRSNERSINHREGK